MIKFAKAPHGWKCTVCLGEKHPAIYKYNFGGGICKEAVDAIKSLRKAGSGRDVKDD